MRSVVLVVGVLAPLAAHAEQPDGTYTLDRGGATYLTDGKGNRHPSCGGEKIFGGQATFVVEYGATILVNGREWEFEGFTHPPDGGPSPPDAHVIIRDRQATDRIQIWFATYDRGRATGLIEVSGVRAGKYCVDAWELSGSYRRPNRRR